MATRRVSQRDAFSRPRPPRKSGRPSSPKDQDDPPPYDSPPSSSSEGSDPSLSGIASVKNASAGTDSSEVLHGGHDNLDVHPHASEDVFAGTGDVSPLATPKFGATSSNIPISPSSTSFSARRENTVPFSSTPQKLARLADINSDLQERIDVLNEQIQEDAAMSNNKVRRLERELASLRAELSHTRERNEQLELARQQEEAEEEELAKQLRRERTEKLRAARQRRLTHGIGSIGSQADLAEAAAAASSRSASGVIDFAPKTTPSVLHRFLGRATDEDGEDLQDDGVDNRMIDSLTDTLADDLDKRRASRDMTGDTLPIMPRLTEVERATVKMRLGTRASKSPAIPSFSSPSASPSLPLTADSLTSPYSAAASPRGSLSKATSKALNRDPESTPSSISRSASGSLRSKRSRSLKTTPTQRAALGNRAMAGKSGSSPAKGKSRASITPLSFIPPASDDPPTRTSSSATLNRGFSPRNSNLHFSPPDPAASGASYISDREGPVLGSPLRDFTSLNPLSPGASMYSRLGLYSPGAPNALGVRTLGSELGAEDFGEGWRADFDDRFGDLELADLMSNGGGGADDERASRRGSLINAAEGDVRPSRMTDFTLGESASASDADGSAMAGSASSAATTTGSVAMDALSAALDPMLKGEKRQTDEHILPLGSLRDAPVETFYLLDRAVAARPSAWIDTDPSPSSRLALEAGPGVEKKSILPRPILTSLPTMRIREDAWSLYPDEDDVEDDESSEELALPPPPPLSRPQPPQSPIVRRERALERMSRTHTRRVSSYGRGRQHPKPKSVLKSLAQRVGVVPHTPARPSSVAYYSQDEQSYDGSSDEDTLSIVHFDGDREARSSHPPHPSSSTLVRRPSNDQQDQSDRYSTAALAHKLQNTSLQTVVQVWMTLQFAALVVVFVYFAAKRGPSAILGGGSSGGPAVGGGRRVRGGRRSTGVPTY